eukprot:2481735-Amphidinium_carterae.1
MALIEWHVWGVYSLAPSSDSKTQIVHRPTRSVAELGVTLNVPRDSLGRVLQKNYGEKESHVVQGAFQIRCLDCFKESFDTTLWPMSRATERFNLACYRAANIGEETSTDAPMTPAPRADQSSPFSSSADTPASDSQPTPPPPPPALDDLGVPAAQG